MSLFWARLHACRQIDKVAAVVRRRYLTEGYGQETEYWVKLQEAKAYQVAHAADANAAVPPYIAAEASRLAMDAIDVANDVVLAGDGWHGTTGPAIAAARRAGKVAVMGAADETAVATALAAALADLESYTGP